MTTNTPTKRLEGDAMRRAPVQDRSGVVTSIPWEMHLRAYAAYSKKYRPQPGLIQGWCRGGFGVEELDEFIPGWRSELPKLETLSHRVATLLTELAQARAEIGRLRRGLAFYADPESYFAVMIIGDRPCGAFDEDWSDTGTELGDRHGKLARETLGDAWEDAVWEFWRGVQ